MLRDGTFLEDQEEKEKQLRRRVSEITAKPSYWISSFNDMLSADSQTYSAMRNLNKQKQYNKQYEGRIREYNTKLQNLLKQSMQPA